MPKQDLPTGTEIRNQATIIFDVNPPINTPDWLNTLDNTPPTSHILALAATQTSPSFPVQWSWTDIGAGIKDFTIFVSDNGGPFTPFVTHTVATTATYPGVVGHTYRFFSQARDLTGNVEVLKTQAEATTTVALSDTTPPVITVSATPETLLQPNNTMVPVVISGTITDNLSGVDLTRARFSVADEFGLFQPSGPITVNVNGSYSFTIQLPVLILSVPQGFQQYTITVSATDNAGNKGSAATGVLVLYH